MIRFTVGLFVAGVAANAFAQAPANPPVRIRGTIEKLEGQNLTIKDRNAQSMSVRLADNFMVVGIFKGSVADIASGKFIGTTTVRLVVKSAAPHVRTARTTMRDRSSSQRLLLKRRQRQ